MTIIGLIFYFSVGSGVAAGTYNKWSGSPYVGVPLCCFVGIIWPIMLGINLGYLIVDFCVAR